MTAFAEVSVSSLVVTAVTVGFVVCGCIAAVMGIYLVLLSLAALFYVDRRPTPAATQLVVLIPAHDEALLVGRCVRSLRAQTYPPHLYRVVVIADNCTDATAAAATAAGADDVLIREEPDARGKGHALRWAMDRLLAADSAPAAFVVVDADSVADPEFLSRLVQPFQTGAQAVQGESLLYGDGSRGTELRLLAFLLVNHVRPTGRAVLGWPATHLAGNGMMLARELLVAKPWGAFTSAEDLEYSIDLQMDGMRIAFAHGAVLLSPAAPTARAAAQQQLRWEGGKTHLARTRIPKLLRAAVQQRRPALLGTAFDLSVPPLGYLAAIAGTAAIAAASLAATAVLPAAAAIPWLVAATAIVLHVLIGMRAGNAPGAAYRALVGAPWFVIAKVARAHRVLGFSADTWVRTERGSTSR